MRKLKIKVQILACFLILVSIFSVTMVPALAQAQGGGEGFSTENPLEGGGGVATKIFGVSPDAGPFRVIVNILIFLASLAFVTAALFLVIGGFRYVAAQSNEEALESAKKTMYHSVIGLAVIILSWVILRMVVRIAEVGEGGFTFFGLF